MAKPVKERRKMAKKKSEIEKVSEEASKEKEVTEEIKQSPETSEVPKEEKSEEKEEHKGEEFSPRFPQFYDGDVPEYYKKLEGAYQNSSSEGQKLAGTLKEKEKEMEVVKKIVNSDEKLKKQFSEKLYDTGYEGDYDDEELTLGNMAKMMDQKIGTLRQELPQAMSQTPELQQMKAEKDAANMAVVKEFEGEHPEITTDSRVQKDLEVAFGYLSQLGAKNQEPFNFENTLNKAWDMVQASGSSDEKVRVATKEAASMQTATSGTAPTGKKTRELTSPEKAMAQNLGLTDEQYIEGKKLSEQSNK